MVYNFKKCRFFICFISIGGQPTRNFTTWVKDLRPSTLFHFLFSFAPSLLTSPHHFKRMSAGDYVGTLVKLDGSVDDGEASAWMTTMACCDAYQQRESVDGAITDGDRRISAILMVLGPELLRRRRQ